MASLAVADHGALRLESQIVVHTQCMQWSARQSRKENPQ